MFASIRQNEDRVNEFFLGETYSAKGNVDDSNEVYEIHQKISVSFIHPRWR